MRCRPCLVIVLPFLASCCMVRAQTAAPFNALDTHLGSLSRLADGQSRSISPKNFSGEKGKGGMATEGTGQNAARELGRTWKVSPSARIKAQSTFTVAQIDGPGAIQQIWMTPAPLDKTRLFILRFYGDGEVKPSVEVPMGDFFACGWAKVGDGHQVIRL